MFASEKFRHPGELPRILYIEQVSALIGKSCNTIRTCATNEKYKKYIPLPFKAPNSRRLLWREEDVLAWLDAAKTATPTAKPRRGPPTKLETVTAERAGLSVKEWRAQQRGGEK